MSFEATRAVWEQSQAKGGARMVLLCIAYHYNDEKAMAWPSIGTIAQETQLSARQVSRAIASLVEIGELDILTKGNGRGRATEYGLTFLVPVVKDDTMSPFVEEKGDIFDIKDDILSIKDDTMSPQLKELKEELQQNNGGGRDDDYPAVVSSWENEMGYMVTPVISDSLREAIAEFGSDGVIRAIGIASASNARTLAYVKGILRKVREKGWIDSRPNTSQNGAGIKAVAIDDQYGGFSL